MSKQTIGLIGLDTSHSTAFTRLLHQPENPHHVPGGRVAAGFPAEAADFPKSADRVEGFTTELREKLGVEIVDSPEAAAEQADLIFITSVDGRKHRALFESVVGMGKPIFIDKPFATTAEDAEAMVQQAQAHGIPLMSCSALRYAQPFQTALKDPDMGEVRAIDAFGPMMLEEALPGLFWYGCHGIEMVVAAMGAGCREVRTVAKADMEVHTLTWDDGRVATYRGLRVGHMKHGAMLHREHGFQTVDIAAADKPFYAGLLEHVLEALPRGRSDVPVDQMVDAVRIMTAGNESRRTGRPVELEPRAAAAGSG